MDQEKKSCCPSGSEPYLAPNYTPKGTEEKIDDLPIYVVGQGEKAVIAISDIFGPDSGRAKLMCDMIADAGYLVVEVDVFKGNCWKTPDNMAGIMEWVVNYTWDKVQDLLTNQVYPYLEKKGVKKIGIMGICYGTYIVFNASTSGKISAGINYHPSLTHFGDPEPLTENVKCPQLLLSAENDHEKVKEGGSVEKILKSKDFGDKCKVKDFPDMKHGWMNRGDLSVAENLRDFKLGMDLTFQFLKENL